MGKSIDAETLQRTHFDGIASKYSAHYGDRWSQRYRLAFINGPLLDDLNLAGARVIEAMCGSGETTGYLLAKGAKVIGIDISPDQMEAFRSRFPNCQAICSSILSTELESNSCDCVVIVGGLHHLHPNISTAIREIHRILKVGGSLCFVEPHKGSLPDYARKVWYRSDSLFAENEASIDLEALKTQFAAQFRFVKERYQGGLAYLLVFNSLIFRIPLWLKRIYSPPLLWLESSLQWTNAGKRFSCFVICRWMKA
jgi:SAM-dependent methyltransferase